MREKEREGDTKVILATSRERVKDARVKVTFLGTYSLKSSELKENAFFKMQVERLTRKEKKLCLLFALLAIWG